MSTVAPAGWYLLTPEGSGWIAVCFGHSGKVCGTLEESEVSTHIDANDRLGRIAKQVQDGDVSDYVEMHEVRAILQAWNEFSGDEFAEDMVSVEFIDA